MEIVKIVTMDDGLARIHQDESAVHLPEGAGPLRDAASLRVVAVDLTIRDQKHLSWTLTPSIVEVAPAVTTARLNTTQERVEGSSPAQGDPLIVIAGHRAIVVASMVEDPAQSMKTMILGTDQTHVASLGCLLRAIQGSLVSQVLVPEVARPYPLQRRVRRSLIGLMRRVHRSPFLCQEMRLRHP